jgi:twitching motility protein PilT
VIAPTEARSAWTETGVAKFTYGDGGGRVRATLVRDQRGPGAALRLLVAEAPAIDRLGLGQVLPWLDRRGLVLIAGPSGSGKTTTLASLVRELGDKRRRVVAIEDPIEIVHVTTASVSQRAIGVHVPSVTAGVAAAMREGADAIVVADVTSAEAARAVVAAVTAGHLVLAAISAPAARIALEVLIDLLALDSRDLARTLLTEAHLGTVSPVSRSGQRSFEVVPGRS